MNTAEFFTRSVAEFDRRVALVNGDQWNRSTPCTEWNVRALVNHLVNEVRWVPELLAGKTLEDVGSSLDGDLLGNDPAGAWKSAVAEGEAAVGAAGALEKRVHVSWGQIPAEEYVGQVACDLALHSWDLARAIGADEQLDPRLVERCWSLMEPNQAALQGSGVFGEPVAVPEGADLQTRLLALIGRKV